MLVVHYIGNFHLRRKSKMAKQSLKDIIKLEYVKCSKDPIYFMKKYCMIQHPVRGRIPFHLYPCLLYTSDAADE